MLCVMGVTFYLNGLRFRTLPTGKICRQYWVRFELTRKIKTKAKFLNNLLSELVAETFESFALHPKTLYLTTIFV